MWPMGNRLTAVGTVGVDVIGFELLLFSASVATDYDVAGLGLRIIDYFDGEA